MSILLVPEGTRAIRRHQFKNLELEEIDLPEGLETISAHCFRLSRLRRLVLPSTVRHIGFGAFSACDNLEEVILPPGIQDIGRYAFSECENLRNVTVPSSAVIGEGAFYDYRRNHGLCPWCGYRLNPQGLCPQDDRYARSWTGSLRLYKGLFWWAGNRLISVKVHCDQTGKPAYSVQFFGKRAKLGSHRDEWDRLRQAGDLRLPGNTRYNDLPRGRVEIENWKVRVFLHPDLMEDTIRRQIVHEFGLSAEMHNLHDIRFIADHSAHYHTADE